jgi:hypothetical protein
VVGITPTSDRQGYWLEASDGGVFAFGDAGFYGSLPGLGFAPAASAGSAPKLSAPIVGMVPSADGRGYFMVSSDGGVFAFGDAHFAGSCPGIGGCQGSAVAVIPDASGRGYWIATNNGNVYSFGDAPYLGAPGIQSSPVTSAVRTPDGAGYWILLADGTVYNYGDAEYLGGASGLGGLNPAAAIYATHMETHQTKAVWLAPLLTLRSLLLRAGDRDLVILIARYSASEAQVLLLLITLRSEMGLR